MTKLISKYTLNPNASVHNRLSDKVYGELIENINRHLIENKDNGVAKIVFGCSKLIVKNFPDYFVQLFDGEEVCVSTAERFKKQLKKGDYKFDAYNSKYHYFYHSFEIKW